MRKAERKANAAANLPRAVGSRFALSLKGALRASQVQQQKLRAFTPAHDCSASEEPQLALCGACIKFARHSQAGSWPLLQRIWPESLTCSKLTEPASITDIQRPTSAPSISPVDFISNLRSVRPAQPACSKQQRMPQPACCGCLAPLRLLPEPLQRHTARTVFQRGEPCRLRQHSTSVQMPQPASQRAPPSTLPPLQPRQACCFRQLRAQMAAAAQLMPLRLSHVSTQRCLAQRCLRRRRRFSSGAASSSARSAGSSSCKKRSEQRNRSSPSVRRVLFGVCMLEVLPWLQEDAASCFGCAVGSCSSDARVLCTLQELRRKLFGDK